MKKKIISLCLIMAVVTAMLMCSGFTTTAPPEAIPANIYTIAQNAANTEIGWPDVELSNSRALYDFAEKLVGYSMDVTNNATGEKGYELVSASPDDEPIMEYALGITSPYDSVGINDKCLFSGVSGYYSTSSLSTIANCYDIERKTQLTDDQISSYRQFDKTKNYQADNILQARNIRKIFESSPNTAKLGLSTKLKPMASGNEWNILIDVPFYYCNYQGTCTPTSSAMALKYIYSSQFFQYSGDQMQTMLYNFLGTTPWWGTIVPFIPDRIYNFCETIGGFLCQGVYNTGYGRSNATWTLATQHIASNLPFLINDIETSSSIRYSNHSMCVVGYDHTTSTMYLVVHTTWADDGTSCRFIDYNSATELGSDFCFTLIPRVC